jgi:hypothetical protein
MKLKGEIADMAPPNSLAVNIALQVWEGISE